jgi:hypothetical protein
MNKNLKRVCIILSGVFLIPLLFFPISSDSVVFMNIARKILEGKLLYVEAIDLKPPLIYFIYMPVYFISHNSEIIVRLIDLLYQVLILWSSFYVITKTTGNKEIGYLACIFYSLIYTSFGPNFTFQSDTHINLIVIWMIYIILNKKPGIKWNLMLGILAGLLFFFKYNIVLMIIPSVLLFWYYQSEKRKFQDLIKFSFYQGLGLIIMISLVSLVFIRQGVWDGFVNVFSFSAFYSSMPPIDSNLLKYIIKTGSMIFADNFSILYIVLIVSSVLYLSKNNLKSENEAKFFQVLGILGLTLLVTVFIERKLYTYHFTRFLLIASIFASVGARYLYDILKENYRNYNIPGKFIIISMIIGVLVFSPVSRWAFSLRLPYYYLTNTEKYDELFERADESANTRVQMKAVADYIKSNATNADTVINISTGANLINLLLSDYNTSAFEQSCFYLGILKIPEWQKQIIEEVTNARWLIIQNNDRHLWINGHNMPSWEALNKDSILSGIVNKDFHNVLVTKNFYILKRNH